MNPSNVNQGFFGVKVSKPGVNVNQANNQNLVYASDYSTTIYYDALNPRMIEGKLPDGTYGIWVSKPGTSANDPNAASNNNLIFNSNNDIFRIVNTITINLSITRSSSTFASYFQSQAHGLSFIPDYTYTLSIDPALTAVPQSTKFSGMYVFSANVGGVYSPFGQAYCTVDANNVYFQIDMSTVASGTYANTATITLLQRTFS